jgi:hypothetical protein
VATSHPRKKRSWLSEGYVMAKHRAEVIHLLSPKTSANEGTNLFCPYEKEFSTIILARSADGMETFACGACYEPEPDYKNVSDEDLNAIYRQLYDNT